MKKICGIVVLDSNTLDTLGANNLNLLFMQGGPVYISDLVTAELESREKSDDTDKMIEFIRRSTFEFKTGVPVIAEKLQALDVSPRYAAFRRIVNTCEDSGERYGLVVSNLSDNFISGAENTVVISLRQLLGLEENLTAGEIEEMKRDTEKANEYYKTVFPGLRFLTKIG
jgi:hypothetical protein